MDMPPNRLKPRRRDAHSRFIGLLKLVLPLAALAVLSSLFLVARTINPEDAIPYAEVDVADRLREPRMTLPVYATVTQNGDALKFTATEARPNNQGEPSTATNVVGELISPSGKRTDLVAQNGTFDSAKDSVYFEGDVVVVTSDGWKIESEDLTSSTVSTAVKTDRLTRVTGPNTTITAQSMDLTANPDKPDSHVLVFKHNVKLIYLPPS